MAKLTDKQKTFVNEYLVDLNATQAAIRAGYSAKTASRIAIELLNKTHVSNKINERMKDREKRTEITQDFVLKELHAIAAAKGSDFSRVVEKSFMKPIFDKEGNKIDEEEVFYKSVELEITDDLPEEKKKAIAGIKQTKDGIVVSTCDKVKALELLGKHLGMFSDTLKLKGDANTEITIKIGGEANED